MRIVGRLLRAIFGKRKCGRSHGPIAEFQFAELTLVNKERVVISGRLLLADCCLTCGAQVSGFRILTRDPADLTDVGFDGYIEGLQAGQRRIVKIGPNEGGWNEN